MSSQAGRRGRTGALRRAGPVVLIVQMSDRESQRAMGDARTQPEDPDRATKSSGRHTEPVSVEFNARPRTGCCAHQVFRDIGGCLR
jgi:hypothetical protein